MSVFEKLLPHITTLTLDCYGTIINWSAGLACAFERIFGDRLPEDRQKLFDTYNLVEAEVEAECFRPYREVLALTVERMSQRFGIAIDAARHEWLAKSLPTWQPFADSNAALQRLKARFQLGVLSNIDRDLFSATASQLDVDFDFLVTAQDVRSYKPNLAHFERALEIVGSADAILHVAQSLFHDGKPAERLGIRFVWINRYGHSNRLDVKPVAEFADLNSLADVLCR